jgi:3-hydroxyacyl-CoA dehydrogenase
MTHTTPPPVACEVVHGAPRDLLVVTIDNPPVNALGHAVREALLQAAERLDADPTLGAMVLRSTGPVFVGGADIREFSGPRRDPLLNVVCDRVNACAKPVVAAMQGAALGGGFEIALAAHYRVAAPAVEVAFPEVLLGLLPGAGGTQRAPRLCGAALALDLMLTGRRLSAADAVAAGLLDVLANDPIAHAVLWAQQLASAGGPVRRARDGQALRDTAAAHAAIEMARERVQRDLAGRFAPARIVECVAAAVDLPYEDGAAVEARAFLECLASPEREALVQRFFAERAARKAARSTASE